MTDIRYFSDQVKASVSCRQLLEAAGTKVDRHGFAVCPLHGDKDASLKVYDGGRGWVCYGCHKGGDVINLARELYGLSFPEAVKQLNDDFGLGLDIGGKPDKGKMLAWKAKQAAENARRRREEKQDRQLESDYWDAFDMWLWLDRQIAEMEPERGGEWPPVFKGYLEMRAAMRERLIEIEERRREMSGRVAGV